MLNVTIELKFIVNEKEEIESIKLYDEELELPKPVPLEKKTEISNAINLIYEIGLEVTEGLLIEDFEVFFEDLTKNQKFFFLKLCQQDEVSSDDFKFSLGGLIRGINKKIDRHGLPDLFESSWDGSNNFYHLYDEYREKMCNLFKTK